MKQHAIGEMTFTQAGWDEFTGKTYDEQLKIVTSGLSPQSERRAAKLLKGVPNGGNIGSGETTQNGSDNAGEASGGNGGHNTKSAKADKGAKA